MVKYKLLWIIFLIACLGGCREDKTVQKPEKPRPLVEVAAAVDKAAATTGDVITYAVTVNRAPDVEMEIPEFGADIAGFRIEDYGADDPKQVEGRVITRRWYKLRADVIGSYIIPSAQLIWWLKSKPADKKQAQTSQIFVEVKSVIKEGEQVKDIVDIKPPIRPKVDYLFWGLVGGGVLLVVLLVTGGIIYYRRRKRAGEIVVKPLAHETALAKLNELKLRGMPEPAAVKRFYFDLSEVFRVYIEDRYNFPATDWTTEEILPRLNQNPGLDFKLKTEGRMFLLNTDRVKFAEYQPQEGDVMAELERAIQFVEATKEAPVIQAQEAE